MRKFSPQRAVILAAALIAGTAYAQKIDDLGIPVNGGGRQFAFTNKQAGTFCGEVNDRNSGGWQGWTINAEKIVNDYSVSVNGRLLDRKQAATIVYPHLLVRTYPDGTKETVTLLDSIDVLVIDVTNPFAQLSVSSTEMFIADSALVQGHQHWRRTDTPSLSLGGTDIVAARRLKRNIVTFAIAAGKDLPHLLMLADKAAQFPDLFIARRKERMQGILDRSPVKFNDRRLTKALAWAKLSLDALIMNQSTSGVPTKGIFAGLPWFNNYWGRDSFISLPGATYITGNFADARDVLMSYARFQQKDSADTNYGRIPNLATPRSVVYNTADGTPWFIKSMYEYVKYSGDTKILEELYPVLVRSIDGTIKFHTDSLGFLTHGDAESWMDAVGPNGPWSPRGNRACEVQLLWSHQLNIGVFVAEYFQDYGRAARWSSLAKKLETNFSLYFVDTTNNLLYDHLRADGTPSSELRPNQMYCIDFEIPEAVRQNVVRTVIKHLVYEHGTSTLAQSDPRFHPYHEFPPYYVKDAAYHNGTVWTWLNGPVTYGASRYDLQEIIYPVAKNSVHQILERGCIGTLSELLDAHPRANETEPRLSGTFSQAWSLAEFIRSVYQDYLGVSVDITSKTVRVNPKLPAEITHAAFTQCIGRGSVLIEYEIDHDRVTTRMTTHRLTERYSVDYFYVYPGGDAVTLTADLVPDTLITIAHSKNALETFHDGKKYSSSENDPGIFLKGFSDKKYFTGLTLAHPETARKFPVLRGPSFPLLTLDHVKRSNTAATTVFDRTDPTGDDNGATGTYTYPTGSYFKKGILDITSASLSYDSASLYCRFTYADLSNPGWHPEYGYQLTLTAIAIHRNENGSREIGLNSKYTVDALHSFDRLIVIGGGIRVENEKHAVLCEYRPKPEDVSGPIGNTPGKSIVFSIPLEYIGRPSKSWRFTILVGAQDDHGGAGIGEFRTVNETAGEWNGGGRSSPLLPNIYDTMIIDQKP